MSLLCLLMAPRMLETAQKFGGRPRIVLVASEVHYLTSFDDAQGCLAGTRKELINACMDFLTAPNPQQCICLVVGPAGSGKTTLAHTIAARCESMGILGASH